MRLEIPIVDVGEESFTELLLGRERAALEDLSSHDPEPDFDLVEPRRVGRRVVGGEPRMRDQPLLNLWCRVIRRVVDDVVDGPMSITPRATLEQVAELESGLLRVHPADDVAGAHV